MNTGDLISWFQATNAGATVECVILIKTCEFQQDIIRIIKTKWALLLRLLS